MIDYNMQFPSKLMREVNQFRLTHMNDDGTEMGWQGACRHLIDVGLQEEGY